jgi:TolA-binding protein
MLLKWGVVLYRPGNRPAAIEKFQRLVEEYPGGQAAAQGQQFLRRLTND